MKTFLVPLVSVLCFLCSVPGSALAATVSGEAVYKQRCASCHDSGSPRVPARDELKKMPATRILRALEFGLMNNVAAKMRQEDREVVAAYLGVAGDDAGKPPAAAYCADRTVKLSSSTKAEWNGWSPALTNTRYQSNDAAGLSFGDVPRLKLKWAYGFDGDIVAFSQPAV